MSDEILVKGADGKWYIMKDGKLLAYGEPAHPPKADQSGGELPKGVSEERHAKMEAPMTTKAPSVPMAPKVVALPKPLSTAVSHESHPLIRELEEIIDQIVKDSGVTFSDSMLVKRFRMIVSARLRDVRNSVETNAMLLRNQKVGGLEMQESEVDRIGAVMEKAFQSFQIKWKEVEMKRLTDWKKKQAQEREAREGQKGKQEQDELEERYKRLVGVRVVNRPAAEAPAKDVVVRPSGADATRRSASLSRPPIADSNHARSASAALLSEAPATGRSQSLVRGGEEKKEEKKLLVPPRPITMLTKPAISPPKPASVTPLSSVLRPTSSKITDIRPAPKLLGPVEELSHLTLQDFRRIGANPTEAAARIEQKIMRLKSESLLRANQGMSAWRSSPLYQQYSQIMNESLSKRMSPDAVLQEKPSLTASEFHAIMELNAKLRF